MSITAADHGETSGELAQRFTRTGELPATTHWVLVIPKESTWNNSPFARFTTPSDGELAAFGKTVSVTEPLKKVNAIVATHEALGGAEGCMKDRICGVPPWVCCLPDICCLGGACLVCSRGRAHLTHMRRELDDFLATQGKEGDKWTLCAASHVSKVDMSKVRHLDNMANKHSPTITTTICWLEVRHDEARESIVGVPRS